jgi:Tripartite tricarboxylate transporter TctB family
MTLHTDHIAGAVLAACGLLIIALSGDLPTGTLSFPGAGMMPKLVAGLLILFGVMVVLRGKEGPALATVAWQDLPHAARVVAITALATLFYQRLGFLITMVLLLFALVFIAERRHPLAAAAFSVSAAALTYLLFTGLLRAPLARGMLGF